ncbi:MAG: hypothetical protein GXO60_01890 [Epsilonproteobacteria bacterium]|nr:hypothetical protein [Campylobacterota bacterium]
MSLSTKYPKLFDKLEDKDLELRHLLNVDENYEDYDSEEFDFDFEEYNFIVYIAEPVQKVLGEEKMSELMVKLNENRAFENFRADEIDLYGLKSSLDRDEIVSLILNQIEEII